MISIVTSSLRMVNIVRMFHLQTVIIAIVLYHHRFTSDGFFEDMWYNQNRKSARSIYLNPVIWLIKRLIQSASSKFVVAMVMGPKLIPVIDLVSAS